MIYQCTNIPAFTHAISGCIPTLNPYPCRNPPSATKEAYSYSAHNRKWETVEWDCISTRAQRPWLKMTTRGGGASGGRKLRILPLGGKCSSKYGMLVASARQTMTEENERDPASRFPEIVAWRQILVAVRNSCPRERLLNCRNVVVRARKVHKAAAHEEKLGEWESPS